MPTSPGSKRGWPPDLARSRAALESEDGSEPGNLRDQFAAADVLAAYFQKKRRWSLAQLCFLALESPVCLAAYHTATAENPGAGFFTWPLSSRWAAGAFAVYWLAKRRGYEAKHLDYRALAEGLKVMFFWRMAGVQDDIGAQYLRKQRSEIDWIRLALRAADLTTAPAQPAASCEWIKSHWIEHQRRYFERSAARNEARAREMRAGRDLLSRRGRRHRRGHAQRPSLLFPGRAAAAETVRARFSPPQRRHRGGRWPAGGSITAYAEESSPSRQQAKQYEQMRGLFSVAMDECEVCLKAGETEHARSIIRRLGHEALRENGDWVLLHRERPMELHL